MRGPSARLHALVLAATFGLACANSSRSSEGTGTGGTSATGGAAATGDASATGGRAGSPGMGGAAGAGGAASAGGGAGGAVVATGGAAGTMTATGGAAGSSAASAWVTIANGGFWNDTDGHRIEAHGGGFLQVGDTWYWFGEDKSKNSGNFFAVNCYASKDLATWQFRNAIITRQTSTDLAAADRIIERPKVVYNDTTKQYVMWLHWDGQNYATAEAGVFTSATVDGDYVQRSHFQPNGNMSRDDTLFKDDDGKAYFISSANNNQDMIMYLLSDDYLTVKSQVITLFTGKSREAPAMFKQNGRYFLITSAATGWDPNQAQVATATNIAGPWSSLSNLGDGTTYDTQSAYVIPFAGSQGTTYIFAADRWQDPDLVSSKYIWIPLQISGSTLAMNDYAQWQLNPPTGAWSDDQTLIPQTGWSLVYADSQETQDAGDEATNAFDGSTSTFWHTQYTGTAAPLPHEIQIDLGASYGVDGFRYVPRQDKDDHGMVAQWQFYVSADKTNWGSALASGLFNADRSEERVMFTRKTGRYIRFVALSEINGNPWTSIAELRLVGGPP